MFPCSLFCVGIGGRVVSVRWVFFCLFLFLLGAMGFLDVLLPELTATLWTWVVFLRDSVDLVWGYE
jgi:hypothetical protein